jgi:predicted DNA-binding WGR domain protein
MAVHATVIRVLYERQADDGDIFVRLVDEGDDLVVQVAGSERDDWEDVSRHGRNLFEALRVYNGQTKSKTTPKTSKATLRDEVEAIAKGKNPPKTWVDDNEDDWGDDVEETIEEHEEEGDDDDDEFGWEDDPEVAEEYFRVYLENRTHRSRKFWMVIVKGSTMTRRWGPIGTTGTTKAFGFSSNWEAVKEAHRLIKQKKAKGYRVQKERGAS